MIVMVYNGPVNYVLLQHYQPQVFKGVQISFACREKLRAAKCTFYQSWSVEFLIRNYF